MSWSFNGGVETYASFNTVDGLPQNGAPISIWSMARFSGTAGGLFLGREAGSTRIGDLVFGSQLFAAADGSAFTVPSNEWVVIGYDDNNAAAGTIRFHLCTDLAGTPTWQHADGGSGGDRSGVVDELRIGDFEAVHMGGHIAATCVASGRLGDAGFEALGTTSMASWVAASVIAYQMNVAVSSTALVNLKGTGADQSGLVGTPTLDNGQEPPNWTYYSPSAKKDYFLAFFP